ncbi:CoA transferase [Pseudomonas typographi]|uniref:CoA transferase n=1 Tax=Pseudomonas typographi TaxID=2715964 RepID=UPI0016891131|nr:CoA transferase [Pseudomonas typographi]MBD1586284.1 CoA transferase [Pseudomonas typographi]
MIAEQLLVGLWHSQHLPEEALGHGYLPAGPGLFASSFAVGLAAQACLGAAALAACELGFLRGAARQHVAVERRHAEAQAGGWFRVNGEVPSAWDAFSGLYRCADGYVRIHANFEHHRNGALALLGLDPATATRAMAESAALQWQALSLEAQAAERGLVISALRSFAEWDATAQGQAVASQPLFTVERIGEGAPLPLPTLDQSQRPLAGVRVLELTRILAGPVAGRTLAEAGADVMLVNAPYLPNIAAIADTSRGKRSVHIDLRAASGHQQLWQLAGQAHVFLQGYRPGALAARGFSPEALAERRPGIVYVSLSAYGNRGPWAERRGFDSLLQTAMGFNQAEAEAFGDTRPRAMPMQILDQATGYLIAFAVAAALRRQQLEGGSWHVQLSLAQTAQWLRGLPRIGTAQSEQAPYLEPYLETYRSGFGELRAVRPSPQLARTPLGYGRPSSPPGTDAPTW